MFTIITPCCRPENLETMLPSIDFDKVDKWIIVYDTSKERTYEHMKTDNEKIVQVDCSDEGSTGNCQRNFAIDMVEDGFIYFLDDDNIMHPDFFKEIYPELSDEHNVYTFNCNRDWWSDPECIASGNFPNPDHIDTSQFVVHKKIVKDTRWVVHAYNADGIFINHVITNNNKKYHFIDKVCSYWNKIKNNEENV